MSNGATKPADWTLSNPEGSIISKIYPDNGVQSRGMNVYEGREYLDKPPISFT